MNVLGNPILLILIAIILVVVVNLLLIASVQNHAKNTGGRTVSNMLKAIKEPFQEGNSDLDELAGLVDQLDPNLTSGDEEPEKSK